MNKKKARCPSCKSKDISIRNGYGYHGSYCNKCGAKVFPS